MRLKIEKLSLEIDDLRWWHIVLAALLCLVVGWLT